MIEHRIDPYRQSLPSDRAMGTPRAGGFPTPVPTEARRQDHRSSPTPRIIAFWERLAYITPLPSAPNPQCPDRSFGYVAFSCAVCGAEKSEKPSRTTTVNVLILLNNVHKSITSTVRSPDDGLDGSAISSNNFRPFVCKICTLKFSFSPLFVHANWRDSARFDAFLRPPPPQFEAVRSRAKATSQASDSQRFESVRARLR
jgi:hypothetical protein